MLSAVSGQLPSLWSSLLIALAGHPDIRLLIQSLSFRHSSLYPENSGGQRGGEGLVEDDVLNESARAP